MGGEEKGQQITFPFLRLCIAEAEAEAPPFLAPGGRKEEEEEGQGDLKNEEEEEAFCLELLNNNRLFLFWRFLAQKQGASFLPSFLEKRGLGLALLLAIPPLFVGGAR